MKLPRDIWAEPPGGQDPVARRKERRLKVGTVVASTLVGVLALGGPGLYISLNESTAASTEDAVSEFRAATGSEDPAERAGPKGSGKRRGDRSGKGPQPAQGSPGKEKPGRSAPAHAAPAAPGGDKTAGSQPADAPQPNRAAKEPKKSDPQGPAVPKAQTAPPEEGVYTWSVDGYEKAPGVHRQLPSRSHRIITNEGGNRWTEHHVFSEQREQWFGLMISGEGVSAWEVRNRVEMGPVEVDKTVVFNPHMFVSRLPLKVGQTWQGSWEGRTSGEYRGRSFERTTSDMEGGAGEVWGTEVVMQMRGEVEGSNITRSWVSPKNRLVVKQYQKMNVTSGPGEYQSEWTGQVESLTPQT